MLLLSELFPAILELGRRLQETPSSCDGIAELERDAHRLAEAVKDLCEEAGIRSGLKDLSRRSSDLLEQAIRLWSLGQPRQLTRA